MCYLIILAKPDTYDLMNKKKDMTQIPFLKKTKFSSNVKQLPYLSACAFFGMMTLTTIA